MTLVMASEPCKPFMVQRTPPRRRGLTPVLGHAEPAPYKLDNTAGKFVDELLPGVKQGWSSRVADNGKGTVWQAPGSTGNVNMLRVMEPTERYPNGYVRFYNEHSQPIGLNGKPGPRPDTFRVIPTAPMTFQRSGDGGDRYSPLSS